MIGMSRFKVLLIAAVVAAGSSGCSSTSAQRRDGAGDVAAPGTPFACVGGVMPPSGTGGSPGAADASGTDGAGGAGGGAAAGGTTGAGGASTGPVMCVVGQSYCLIQDHNQPGAQPSRSCNTLADGGLGVCANHPTCACICGQTSCTFCSCDDSGGFVTITCMPI
jgi:hypothetical protein